jgi:hypothetical protein
MLYLLEREGWSTGRFFLGKTGEGDITSSRATGAVGSRLIFRPDPEYIPTKQLLMRVRNERQSSLRPRGMRA